MKMKHIIGCCILTLGFVHYAQSQTFSVDITTDSAVRLYEDSTHLAPSPVGRALWLVADMGDTPGIQGIEGNTIDSSFITSILNGSGDDKLVLEDSVAGSLFGAQDGKFFRTTTISSSFSSAAGIYLFLWNNNFGEGTVGDQFGYQQLTITPSSGFGVNTIYTVPSAFSSDQLTVVPEPIPTAMVMLTSSAIAGFVLRRRIRNS